MTENEENITTTETESEEKINDVLQSNINSDSNSHMDNIGFMESNGEETLSDSDSSDNSIRNNSDISLSEDAGFGTEPPAENADVSDGNAAHMEGYEDVTVSDGNALPHSATVSSGDVYNEYYYTLSCSCGDGMASPFTEADALHINESLDALLYTAHGILFFIIFAWAEKKVSNAVRRLFRSEKIK